MVQEESGYEEPLSLCSLFRRPHNSARKIHASAVGFSPDERREILEQARGAVIGTLHWLAWEALGFHLRRSFSLSNSH